MTPRSILIELAATQLHTYRSDINADNAHAAVEHICTMQPRCADYYHSGLTQQALERLVNAVVRTAQKRADFEARRAAR